MAAGGFGLAPCGPAENIDPFVVILLYQCISCSHLLRLGLGLDDSAWFLVAILYAAGLTLEIPLHLTPPLTPTAAMSPNRLKLLITPQTGACRLRRCRHGFPSQAPMPPRKCCEKRSIHHLRALPPAAEVTTLALRVLWAGKLGPWTVCFRLAQQPGIERWSRGQVGRAGKRRHPQGQRLVISRCFRE